jgi:hypothetical protein
MTSYSLKDCKNLRKEGCTDSEIYSNAAEKLYELEPSPDAAFNMANMFVKKEKFEKAFDYYDKAIWKKKILQPKPCNYIIQACLDYSIATSTCPQHGFRSYKTQKRFL